MTEQDARHLLADVLEERQQLKLSEKIRANYFVEIPSSDVLAAIMRAASSTAGSLKSRIEKLEEAVRELNPGLDI